jgi:molybdopterin synthase catalytic subunit
LTVRLQREDFDPGAEIEALTAGNARIGGVASFVGLVRDVTGHSPHKGPGQLRAMTLEHYPGMTERMIARIEEEARRRWPLEASLVIHRYGRLEPGARIVLVVAASSHRDDAFAACRFLIDWLKTKAPFWKLEEGTDGAEWVAARAEDDAAAAGWADAPLPAEALKAKQGGER